MLLTVRRKPIANFKDIHGSIRVDCVPREIPRVPSEISHLFALISIELNALLKCILRIIKDNKLMKRLAIAFYCALVRTTACALFIEQWSNEIDLIYLEGRKNREWSFAERKKKREHSYILGSTFLTFSGKCILHLIYLRIVMQLQMPNKFLHQKLLECINIVYSRFANSLSSKLIFHIAFIFRSLSVLVHSESFMNAGDSPYRT